MTVDLLAKVGGIFALLTFLHFVADWVFQSHAEAMAKPSNHWVRARHCLVYTAICCGVIWLLFHPLPRDLGATAVILFVSHFAEDTYLPVYVWARFIRRPPEMANAPHLEGFKEFASTALGKILLIAIDQIVHITFLVPIAFLIVRPDSGVMRLTLDVLALLVLVTLLGSKILKRKL